MTPENPDAEQRVDLMASWNDFAKNVLYGATQEELSEAKTVFFAGAMSAHAVFYQIGKNHPNDEVEALIEKQEAHIKEVMKEVIDQMLKEDGR